MIICINSNAAGKSSRSRRINIEKYLRGISQKHTTVFLNGSNETDRVIRKAVDKGETDFVVAGGNRTVNRVLNLLLNIPDAEKRKSIRLSAIDFGKSNDFYKPLDENKLIHSMPDKFDFDQAQPCDVGCVTLELDGKPVEKYFLVSASCGVTTETYKLFQNPDSILRFFQRSNKQSARIYAALKTILTYKNFYLYVRSQESGNFRTSVTNLTVVKNPNLSGDNQEDTITPYSSGNFIAHLSYGININDRMRQFFASSRGKLSSFHRTRTWSTDSLTISSSKPFNVGYDGEIQETRLAQFSLLSKHIHICP